MKNLKAHHHLAIASMLLFGVVSVWAWGTVVFAGTAATTVDVYVGPPDSCPNIPGYQMGVPSGMEVDGNGNCFTPPPPPVDICNNIDGMQETLPDGYYQDVSGACLPQPTPPVDVCSNLDGTQTSVPDGYTSTIDDRCVRPPTDVCDNIDGPQYLTPEDMERTDNGVCFTPSTTTAQPPLSGTPVDPWVEPETPREAAGDVKNIPDFLDDFFRPLIDAIPNSVKEALRSLPPVLAQTFPYAVFGVHAAAASVLGWQAVREVGSVRKLSSLLGREQAIANEKDRFVTLASHYLLTPFMSMKRSVDTAGHVQGDTSALKASVSSLGTKLSTVISDAQTGASLKTLTPPVRSTDQVKAHRTSLFWIPVTMSITIVLLSNFLLGVVGDVELGGYNLLLQACVFASVTLLLHTSIHNRDSKLIEREHKQRLVAHEEAVDGARNEFIARSTMALSEGLKVIDSERAAVKGTGAEALLNDSYERFKHLLEKFSLLDQIQTGVVGATEKFDIGAAIDDVINAHKSEIDQHKLTIVNTVNHSDIKQRRSLFDYVLGSLIDNAINSSKDGETITISSSPHESTLSVSISQNSHGLSEETLQKVFKPGTSALDFNYDGLGLSLFLDKIIMDYLGGDISAHTESHKKTTFTVTTATS